MWDSLGRNPPGHIETLEKFCFHIEVREAGAMGSDDDGGYGFSSSILKKAFVQLKRWYAGEKENNIKVIEIDDHNHPAYSKMSKT